MKTNLILFPSSYIYKNRIDEDLANEYNECKKTGLYDIVLFSYEDWFNHHKLVLFNKPSTIRKGIYRGWMMQPELYSQFYLELKKNNIELITNPKSYNLMHIFPNAYKYLKYDTAKIKTYPLHSSINIDEIKRDFNDFIVKDYVKSVKGSEFPNHFNSSITQIEFDKWMQIFYKYRADLLTGGICIKEFLPLKHYGDITNEYRVFYCNGKIISIYPNSGQAKQKITINKVPEKLIYKYCNLNSPYYTIDYAELKDGTWKILECGDGSVSGLCECQNIQQHYINLYNSINNLIQQN